MTKIKLSHNSEWKKYVLTSDEDIAFVINKIRQHTGDTKSHPRRTRCPLEHTNPDGKLEIKQDGYMLCWGRHHNQSMWKPVGDLIGVEFEFTGGESKPKRKNPPKKITLAELNRMEREVDDGVILYSVYFDNQYEFLLGKQRFSFNTNQIKNHLKEINKFVLNRRVVSSDVKSFLRMGIIFNEVIYNHAAACWLVNQTPSITLDELKNSYKDNINQIENSNQGDILKLENRLTPLLAELEIKNPEIKFNQSSASGRMYCSPVSYSKNERSNIKAGINNILIQADFSQNEPRILAHLSQDENLINVFNNGGDIYFELAKKVYKTDEPTPEQRNAMKPVWLSVFYGASIKSLINDDIDEDMAKEIHTTLWKEYEEVKRLKDIEADYPFINSILGRRCSLTDAYGVLQEYKAINYICQSSAADILKKIILELYPLLKDIGCEILFGIHDALLFDCPVDKIDEAEIIIKKVMENCVELEVPQIVEFQYGYDWGNMSKKNKIQNLVRRISPERQEIEWICRYNNINLPENKEGKADAVRWLIADKLKSADKKHSPYISKIVKITNDVFRPPSIYIYTYNKVENVLGISTEDKIKKNTYKNDGMGYRYEFPSGIFNTLNKKIFKEGILNVWGYYPTCDPKDIVSVLSELMIIKSAKDIKNYKTQEMSKVDFIMNNLKGFIKALPMDDIEEAGRTGAYHKAENGEILIPLSKVLIGYNQKYRMNYGVEEFKNILDVYSHGKYKFITRRTYGKEILYIDISLMPDNMKGLDIYVR